MDGGHEQTIRRLYDAWNRGDVEGVLEHLTGDVEFRTSGVHPGIAAAYHGRDGMLEFWEQFVGTWESLSVEVEEVLQRGEHALATFRFRGVGREGIELTRPFAHLLTFRDGRVCRVRGIADHDEARAAFAAVAA